MALATAARVETDMLMLSLPQIHCAACIGQIEAALVAVPGVQSARVNLTLKRGSVTIRPGVMATALVDALAAIGHEAHELDHGMLSEIESDRQGRELLMRLAVAGFSMMNIMILSVAVWSGATDGAKVLFYWISAAIALPTVAFSAQPFFRSAYMSLRVGRLNMDVPISLAILLACAISVSETVQGGRHAWFDAAVSLTFFLLAGRYLDYRSRAAARSAAAVLSALEVPRAWRVGPLGTDLVAVAELIPGDLVLVRPGGRMPVDGVVTVGQSEVDRAILTGESMPVFAGPGSLVAAGEANLTGPLTVRVTHAGQDSSLHRMTELVAVAETARHRYTTLADRAARIYAPAVHILSFGAFVVWMAITGDLRFALNIAAAVLIITCPCALGLAVPAVATAASGQLFRQGLLIKDGSALERLAQADVVVFDKTGTLTLGVPKVRSLAVEAPDVLAVAFALAEASAHPLAQALAAGCRAAKARPAIVTAIVEMPGFGISGLWQGKSVRLGRADWIGAVQGTNTATHLRIGAAPPITFVFDDSLRPGAREAVTGLRALGLRVILMSGDVSGPVNALADQLGIVDRSADLLPSDKVARINALTLQGHHVLMIGDGLNDTSALASAHVSIAPASALDAARAASDIVLLGRSLGPVAEAVRIARVATHRMRQNFGISIAYNIVAVPFALLGLATPLLAALAMSASSITVSLNAMRMR
jgi:P-type Cu2+ transporter